MTRERVIGLPLLHSAQIKIVEHPARFKVVSAGRRFGKGVLGVSEAFVRACRGQKCRWIAPTYASDSYQSGWRVAMQLAGDIPGVVVHLQRREFSFPSGGWVQFRTAEEPDSLRGEGIDFVIFDESAHIRGLQDIWDLCVRPSLMDRKGHAWFISTPKGFNFFQTLFNRGRDGEAEWACFQFSSNSNPTIDPAEIASMRKGMTSLQARQEVDAEFVQLAGALFKRENIRVIEAAPPGLRWVRAWDIAFTTKTTSDFTAGAKVAMDRDGTIIIADMVHGRMEWPDAVRCIADTARMDGREVRTGVEVVGAQIGALQTLLRDPLLAGYCITPIQVHTDKITRALPLVARSEQGKLAMVRGHFNIPFLDEACAFEADCDHDDQVDAASSALMMLENPAGGVVASQLRANPVHRPFEPSRIEF